MIFSLIRQNFINPYVTSLFEALHCQCKISGLRSSIQFFKDCAIYQIFSLRVYRARVRKHATTDNVNRGESCLVPLTEMHTVHFHGHNILYVIIMKPSIVNSVYFRAPNVMFYKHSS